MTERRIRGAKPPDDAWIVRHPVENNLYWTGDGWGVRSEAWLFTAIEKTAMRFTPGGGVWERAKYFLKPT